ncbi:MFS transporter [Paenibacillus sp. Z6-24]
MKYISSSKGQEMLSSWKYPAILLTGIGIAYTGDWIFLIALNLTMLDMSGSALAIAGLYMLQPFAALCTNGWAGSLIDRMNKRNLMVMLDLMRAVLLFTLPFFDRIWPIYGVVWFIYMASAVFRPSSMAYIVQLVPSDHRKRFNAVQSLISSGAFLIGPAIAGLLFLIMSPQSAIILTAAGFLCSGLITMLLPDLERSAGTSAVIAQKHAARKLRSWLKLNEEGQHSGDSASSAMSWALLKKDWTEVAIFSSQHKMATTIYLLFYLIMVLAAGLDSQEVALTKEVLHVTDSEYSYLVSIAGAGLGVGALVNMLVIKRLSVAWLLGAGAIGTGIGYIIYAFGGSLMMAGTGFFLLAFSLAFANTGFTTFYQNHVPASMMGRISSVYSLVMAVQQIVCVFLIGAAAQLWSISGAVQTGAVLMLLVAIMLYCISIRYLPVQSEAKRILPAPDI